MEKRIIFVLGGCISGLGKGIVSASLGNILINQKYKINITKFDPYLNYSAKYLSPGEHGEVFVTGDGAEVDLDVGHYQRFTGLSFCRDNCYTSGRIIGDLINKDKRGELGGKTLQFIPTVTDKIGELFRKTLKDNDISIIEIGGTIGDLESYPYIHAISDLANSGDIKIDVVQLVYIFENNGENKTKPAQNSIRDLRSFGVEPSVVICRSKNSLGQKTLDKLSKTSRINKDNIFKLENVEDLYEIPSKLFCVIKKLGLGYDEHYTNSIYPLTPCKFDREIKIDIVGKYGEDIDAYLSVCESLKHASSVYGWGVNLQIANGLINLRKDTKGVVIPGGFGNRGIEEKIEVVKYCREKNIPILGICLGMQLMFLDLIHYELGMLCKSEEGFGNQNGILAIERVNDDLSMVLGSHKCSDGFYHIFRHRYCCKSDIMDNLKKVSIPHYSEEWGYPTGLILHDHQFYRGVQYHPEFESTPNSPSKDFMEFIWAIVS